MSASSFPVKQKKFGLIQPKNKKKATAPARKQLSMFSSLEDDDDDDAGGDIDRANKELSRRAASCDMSLLEASDSKGDNIYDYDGAYDDFKQEAVQKQKQSSLLSANDKPAALKSKYIGHLQSVAKVREIESDRRYERKLLKERKAEDEQFGDKQKFVTSAYRKKLLEEQKWEYEDKLADKVEEQTGAGRQGMQGFYSNLFTKNIAFGGDVATSATSAYTAGSERQKKNLLGSGDGDGDGDGAEEKVLEDSSSSSRLEGGEREMSDTITCTDTGTPVTSAAEGPVTVTDAEKSSSRPAKRPHAAVSRSPDEVDEDQDSAVVEAVAPAPSREAVVQSAKERFLARKLSKQQKK